MIFNGSFQSIRHGAATARALAAGISTSFNATAKQSFSVRTFILRGLNFNSVINSTAMSTSIFPRDMSSTFSHYSYQKFMFNQGIRLSRRKCIRALNLIATRFMKSISIAVSTISLVKKLGMKLINWFFIALKSKKVTASLPERLLKNPLPVLLLHLFFHAQKYLCEA